MAPDKFKKLGEDIIRKVNEMSDDEFLKHFGRFDYELQHDIFLVNNPPYERQSEREVQNETDKN